MARIVICVI